MANNSFSLDLRAFVDKAKGNLDKVVRGAVLDVAARIVQRSPVGDASLWKDPPPKGYVGGRFRANFDAALGASPSNIYPDIDPTGQVSLDRIAAVIPDKAGGNVFYIANNLPYAVRLEDGWSTQAPAGMIGLVVTEWKTIVDDAVGKVKEGSS